MGTQQNVSIMKKNLLQLQLMLHNAHTQTMQQLCLHQNLEGSDCEGLVRISRVVLST